MSITTKTGDKGKTSLLSGERVPKHHVRVEAFGVVDELSAMLGIIRAEGDDFLDGDESAFLKAVQEDLFDLGAALSDSSGKGDLSPALENLELRSRSLEQNLPKLNNFILPGGHPLAAKIHLARTICRRAEREMIQVNTLAKGALPYINRLSDYLFLLARTVNQKTKTDEILWKK